MASAKDDFAKAKASKGDTKKGNAFLAWLFGPSADVGESGKEMNKMKKETVKVDRQGNIIKE